MFYSRSLEPALDPALFKNPTCEYRGTPFWAWNDRLDPEELIRQIHIFKEMGFGGFHMHVRTGLDTEYLSDEYMEAIRLCIDEAKKLDMLAYLYDEDRWPSGSCGGRVTRDHPEFTRKSLLFTMEPYAPDRPHQAKGPEAGRGQEVIRQDNGQLLTVLDLKLDEKGYLIESKLVWCAEQSAEKSALSADQALSSLPSVLPGYIRWYAYMEHSTEDPWFNNAAYLDTLNPAAVRRFIDLTHERYQEAIGDEFGRGTKTIFTDEPQFMPKEPLAFASEPKDVMIPWTDGLDRLYEERYGEAFWPLLPELFFEKKPLDKAKRSDDQADFGDHSFAPVRLRMQNLLTDRFVESYCRQIGDWCRTHQLLLTGHVMGEPTLESQTQAVGDAMRAYEAFGIPGIDMLCDFHEYTTAKQAASRVRQLGKEGMLSELYGVTGWDYDFHGYKLQGDWQAALGVTLRVPHLSWMSMHGEAKRDYPACIGYQSPWYEKYGLIEDHFARLSTVLTRGKALVRVGVIHPIESFWLLWGPGDQTGDQRAQMEQQFGELAETLLLGTIDFDYFSEACLEQDDAGSSAADDGRGKLSAPSFAVGKMAYDVVIVPPLLTLRAHTLQRLAAFQADGGRILWQGERPRLIDGLGQESADPALWASLAHTYEKAEKLGTDAGTVLGALEPVRFLDIRREDGRREDQLIYQLREDGNCRWLFICQGKNPVSPDVDPAHRLKFRLSGRWTAEIYDTQTGEIRPLTVAHEKGQTVFERVWHMHDSLLLRLSEDNTMSPMSEIDGEKRDKDTISIEDESRAATNPAGSGDLYFGPASVRLEEPNMLLLDLAEYAVEPAEEADRSASSDRLLWFSEEEVLRIDNIVRGKLGIPLRRKEVAQPYTLPKEDLSGYAHLCLRFRFSSELPLEGCRLAMEEPELARIWLNGEPVENSADGWYVDRCIRTVPLPALASGDNVLEMRLPIGPRTNLECAYLLGDFGVRIFGTKKQLTGPVREIGFGDMVPQGLPFYTGNLVYLMKIHTEESFTLRIPQYRGGLTEVLLDGERAGEIVYSPYELTIRTCPGVHELGIRLYGTRQNGFAQLHHTQGVYFYQSPNSWRSDGDLWTYEYQFKRAGILTSPELHGAVFLREDGIYRRREASGTKVREHS